VSSPSVAASTLLGLCRRILVLTGAGISAESGVPTFRGAEGLWQKYRPEELANPEAFARDPRLVWEWYGLRRAAVAGCRPNAGHLALARWVRRRRGVQIVTQNVDGLHEAALLAAGGDPGDPLLSPIRLHGSITHVRCTGCAYHAADSTPVNAASEATLPRCPDCSALLRPDVVWFGESLPADQLERAARAAEEADVCLVVGTACVVFPAAGFALRVHQRGRPLVVVDPDQTAYDQIATIKLSGEAGVVLPELLEGGRKAKGK
jgi:NAD-dependent protein deacetylase/lipoamidase